MAWTTNGSNRSNTTIDPLRNAGRTFSGATSIIEKSVHHVSRDLDWVERKVGGDPLLLGRGEPVKQQHEHQRRGGALWHSFRAGRRRECPALSTAAPRRRPGTKTSRAAAAPGGGSGRGISAYR